MDVWQVIGPFFTKNEKWGKPHMMDWSFLYHLYMLRMKMAGNGADWPMIIHCGYQKAGHAPDSFHRIGMAADFHLKTEKEFSGQIRAVRWSLQDLGLDHCMGLGVYPEWNNPGFHLDNRGRGSEWVYQGGEYIYGPEARDILAKLQANGWGP